MRVRSGGQTLGEHPSRDELSAFLRGDLSAEERRALVRHLLSRCERCSSEIDLLLGGQDGSAYDDAIERAWRSVKGLEREHRREKARIQEIAARLPEKSSAVPRGLPRKGKADVEKLEALLAKSWSLRYEDPGEMVRYAMMAVQCAKDLDARVLGRERVLDLLGGALPGGPSAGAGARLCRGAQPAPLHHRLRPFRRGAEVPVPQYRGSEQRQRPNKPVSAQLAHWPDRGRPGEAGPGRSDLPRSEAGIRGPGAPLRRLRGGP